MRYNNWNPMTADEPDDSAGLREDEIERRANCLIDDEDWVDAVLCDGIDCKALATAVAEAYVPGGTHARVGGLLMDALWKLAKEQATETIDDSDCDGE